MSKIAAFFDIDGTLYREGLISEIFKRLIKYEIIKPEKWYVEVKPEYTRWDKRQGNYDNYLLKMAEIYVDAIKNIHKSQIEFIARQVVEQKGDRLYTFTRDKVKWHKEQGHKVITISGSPLELVREMAIKHGFDDFQGAEYVLDENQTFTGEVIPMWDSHHKEQAIKSMVIKYDIDLSKSYAYGDTSGDFSMLEMVGNPFCINPTKELIGKILKNDRMKEVINIVVERKDVIYMLKPECINLY